MKTLDLLRAGLPLVEDAAALRVTAIKKRYVDQMPDMPWREFTTGMGDGSVSIVGRVRFEEGVEPKLIVVRDSKYALVGARDFVTLRDITPREGLSDDELRAERQLGAATERAWDEFNALPQIFWD
jgi:hypothetical protein